MPTSTEGQLVVVVRVRHGRKAPSGRLGFVLFEGSRTQGKQSEREERREEREERRGERSVTTRAPSLHSLLRLVLKPAWSPVEARAWAWRAGLSKLWAVEERMDRDREKKKEIKREGKRSALGVLDDSVQLCSGLAWEHPLYSMPVP